LFQPKRRLLRSRLVWWLSGLSYSLGIRATRGRPLTPADYFRESKSQMLALQPYFDRQGSVLEFGSGLGGNLISTSSWFSAGTGIDVNPGYVRISRRLAKREGIGNVQFAVIPRNTGFGIRGRFDLVFEVGVFERLSPEEVGLALRRLCPLVSERGILALTFLSPRAKGTSFVSRLGEDAYYYWRREEVTHLLQVMGFRIRDTCPWSGVGPEITTDRLPPSDLYVSSPRP
jgi:hypothetical protein